MDNGIFTYEQEAVPSVMCEDLFPHMLSIDLTTLCWSKLMNSGLDGLLVSKPGFMLMCFANDRIKGALMLSDRYNSIDRSLIR